MRAHKSIRRQLLSLGIGALLVVAVIEMAGGRTTSHDYERSYREAARLQMKIFESHLRVYMLDVGEYPTTEQGLDALLECPAGVKHWRGPYFEFEPPTDPWGRHYVYRRVDELPTFRSLGPDGLLGVEDDIASDSEAPEVNLQTTVQPVALAGVAALLIGLLIIAHGEVDRRVDILKKRLRPVRYREKIAGAKTA